MEHARPSKGRRVGVFAFGSKLERLVFYFLCFILHNRNSKIRPDINLLDQGRTNTDFARPWALAAATPTPGNYIGAHLAAPLPLRWPGRTLALFLQP